MIAIISGSLCAIFGYPVAGGVIGESAWIHHLPPLGPHLVVPGGLLGVRLNLPAAFVNSRAIARQLHLPYRKLFLGVLASGWKNARQLAFMANGFKAFRLATENGDLEKGILPVGQVMGLLRDEPTVKEVVERIVAEAKQVRERLASQLT